ncbi:ankyrin repeats [Ceratobasidium sp. AG-Ba]|nr:ankyrin repeats [Ceratobasidium sp. AG-Ba]
MVRADTASKNIWIAAGDGDLQRVRELVEEQGISPNAPDDVIGYTPMHAAASYGHLDILGYLIGKGGDVNITDEEGDTPLYTAETVTVAQFLVEHGAEVDIKNSEDQSVRPGPLYMFLWCSRAQKAGRRNRRRLSRSRGLHPIQELTPQSQPSEQEGVSGEMTDALIAETEEIIARCEREGRDPHDELTQVVGRTVLGGMAWAALQDQAQSQNQERDEQRDIDMPER